MGTDLTAMEVLLDTGWVLVKGATLQASASVDLVAAVTDLTAMEVVLDTGWLLDKGVTLQSAATVDLVAAVLDLADAAVDFGWPAVVDLVEVDAVLDLEDAPMDVGVPTVTLDKWLSLVTTLLSLVEVALMDAAMGPEDAALLALDGCLAVVTLGVAAAVTNLELSLIHI